ncbi:glutathione S-transferase U17-like [Sesamum indicum]|uniref:glutathione transferase n=1 Tax=Sesamum indicum TaxID=4182 RepID=A0A6I9TZV9_SESIN|nr:glutathione S-transferase U17-like [Sesamum indicum]
MGSDKVKLLGAWQSPYVMRARIALHMKSVEYEYEEEDLYVAKSDLLLKSNPVYKKVPVFIHADRPVSESLVILQYINEVWASGPAILPSDAYDRAIARFWAAYIDDKWFPHLRASVLSGGEEAKSAAEKTAEGLVLLEEAFTMCSKGHKFFGGERIGYLDIALGSFLGWIRVTEQRANASLIDESKTPKLSEWAQHFCADVVVKDVMHQTDKLFEFAKLLAAKHKSSGEN